jgi:hypothetical protein
MELSGERFSKKTDNITASPHQSRESPLVSSRAQVFSVVVLSLFRERVLLGCKEKRSGFEFLVHGRGR